MLVTMQRDVTTSYGLFQLSGKTSTSTFGDECTQHSLKDDFLTETLP